METIQQHFKSDFKVFIDSEAGWGVPFILKFWTNAPSRPYIASYDGANFTNCHIMDDGRLCVSFDNHHLGLGILMYQPTFFIDDECFRTGVCDESVPAAPLVVKDAPVVEDFGHDYFRLQTECTVLIPQGAVSMSYPGLVYASSPITLKAGDVAECKFDEYSLFGTQEGFYKKSGERYSFVARRSYTAEEDIELFIAYPSSENHVIPTANITHEGSDRTITLSLNGSNQLVTYGTLPAFYMKGERGDTGERGAQGPKGDKGDTGATGATGPKGETGPQGQQGIQGVQGPKGETGATGPKGERGLQGEKGEPFRYTDFTPEQLEGLRGPQGETGPAGPVGPQGERGPKGDSVTMFPAVTIFGQPTIQETQMSGFTAENYAQFPFMVDFAGRTWRIDFAVTTGADVSQQHNIFDSAFGLAFAFKSGKFLLAMSSNGTSWNLGATSGTHNIAANTTYYIRITWDGTAYVLAYSTDKVSWTNDITVTSSESLASKQIIIGKSLDNAHIFNGSINFAEARLTIANVIVWEGMEEVGTATRMALDMSNIDEAGKQRVNDIVKAGSFGAEVTSLDHKVDDKQDKLIAGSGITIAADGKTISAKGGDAEKYLQEIKEAMQSLPDGSAVSAQVALNTEEIAGAREKIENVDNAGATDNDEVVKWTSNDEQYIYAYIDKNGIHAKNIFDLKGNKYNRDTNVLNHVGDSTSGGITARCSITSCLRKYVEQLGFEFNGFGRGGESTDSMMAYLGCGGMIINEALTIPASGSVTFSPKSSLIDKDGRLMYFGSFSQFAKAGGRVAIDEVSINGIKGTITSDAQGVRMAGLVFYNSSGYANYAVVQDDYAKEISSLSVNAVKMRICINARSSSDVANASCHVSINGQAIDLTGRINTANTYLDTNGGLVSAEGFYTSEEIDIREIGTITNVYADGLATAVSIKFTRAEHGEATIVEKGTRVVADTYEIGKSGVITAYINNFRKTGKDIADDWAEQMHRILEYSDDKKFILGSSHYFGNDYTQEEIDKIEGRLKVEFGERYFSGYEYLKDCGLQDVVRFGVLTQQQVDDAIANGNQNLPAWQRPFQNETYGDFLHFNDYAHYLIARKFITIGIKLGFWKEADYSFNTLYNS